MNKQEKEEKCSHTWEGIMWQPETQKCSKCGIPWRKAHRQKFSQEKDWIKEVLDSLHFVVWDRYIVDEDLREVYGWLKYGNPNTRDFVLLEFDLKKKEVYFVATSSAKWSKTIAKLLDSPHSDCIKVDFRNNL